MRLITVDTSLLLPAFLARSAKPHGRGLLILFALGASTFHEFTFEEERRVLEAEAERLGARLVGPPVDEEFDAIKRRRAELRDLLPIRAPDDLCLVGSIRLFDELERKVREVGRRFDPQLPEEAAATVRRVVERLSTVIVDFESTEILPAWTSDPEDDYLVEMAFRSDAFALVARDRAIVPEPKMTWSDEARAVTVNGYWQGAFIEEQVNNSGFAIDDVDPRLMELALAP